MGMAYFYLLILYPFKSFVTYFATKGKNSIDYGLKFVQFGLNKLTYKYGYIGGMNLKAHTEKQHCRALKALPAYRYRNSKKGILRYIFYRD